MSTQTPNELLGEACSWFLDTSGFDKLFILATTEGMSWFPTLQEMIDWLVKDHQLDVVNKTDYRLSLKTVHQHDFELHDWDVEGNSLKITWRCSDQTCREAKSELYVPLSEQSSGTQVQTEAQQGLDQSDERDWKTDIEPGTRARTALDAALRLAKERGAKPGVEEAIREALSTGMHIPPGLIESGAEAVREALTPVFKEGDRVFVTDYDPDWSPTYGQEGPRKGDRGTFVRYPDARWNKGRVFVHFDDVQIGTWAFPIALLALVETDAERQQAGPISSILHTPAVGLQAAVDKWVGEITSDPAMWAGPNDQAIIELSTPSVRPKVVQEWLDRKVQDGN